MVRVNKEIIFSNFVRGVLADYKVVYDYMEDICILLLRVWAFKFFYEGKFGDIDLECSSHTRFMTSWQAIKCRNLQQTQPIACDQLDSYA